MLFSTAKSMLPSPVQRAQLNACLSLAYQYAGRSGVGKTALRVAADAILTQTYFDNGMFFGTDASIADANQQFKVGDQMQHQLRGGALGGTRVDELVKYALFDGPQKIVDIQSFECVGESLTAGADDVDEKLTTQQSALLARLVKANVVWLMIGCPPSGADGAAIERYQHDLRNLVIWEREVLMRHHQSDGGEIAVALVPTKLDTIADSEGEARELLTDTTLTELLRPLVMTLKQMPNVREAVIAPTSALGFGVADAVGEAANGEKLYAVKAGRPIDPFGVKELLLWTLVHGLAVQDVPGNAQLAQLAGNTVTRLSDLLFDLGPWHVPIKQNGRSCGP